MIEDRRVAGPELPSLALPVLAVTAASPFSFYNKKDISEGIGFIKCIFKGTCEVDVSISASAISASCRLVADDFTLSSAVTKVTKWKSQIGSQVRKHIYIINTTHNHLDWEDDIYCSRYLHLEMKPCRLCSQSSSLSIVV